MGKVEPPNTAFQIANNYVNNIASSGGYCSREGWVVSWMKKPYAQQYAAILQVIYLWRWHTYFSNKATVTLCQAEHKKPVNWCLIMLQCLGVELHRWDNNYGGDVFVAGPVVDILLRKWIPLEDRPDNVTLEPVEEEKKRKLKQKWRIPLKHSASFSLGRSVHLLPSILLLYLVEDHSNSNPRINQLDLAPPMLLLYL